MTEGTLSVGVVMPVRNGAGSLAAAIESVIGQMPPPRDIVVVDGLGAHRARGARAAVEARGAVYEILPPYSPDL